MELSGGNIMDGEQQTHDAQKTLADLRDHLARHDKPIAFLFGAGTSCSVVLPVAGTETTRPLIPAVPGLTEACRKDGVELGGKYEKAWTLLEAQCGEAKQEPHVENILSRLRMMLIAIGKDDTLSGLKVDELQKLEECVRKTIARLVTPDLKELPAEYPHRKFARWLARSSRKSCVEIFTVNYDVLIEHALESERVPVFDGFVGSYQPFFHPDSLRRAEASPGLNWTRVWKMHGSVTWRRIVQDGRSRVVRGEPDPTGEMILPSFQKYDESRQQPYASFTDRLTRFLEQDDALLIVAGFGFGDEHINNLIFGALENRPRTHVYALQFEELAEENVLVKRAYHRSNLVVVGPKTGIIGGRRARWAPSETPSFMHGVFELRELADDDEGFPKSNMGLMKIGDFDCFCHFLQSMAS
jgi:hypothetical protein